MNSYIVFDLEWNQSPSGRDGAIDRLPFEIIEIGAVKLDENFQVISQFHELIKPRVYKQIHFKISEIIHMDMKQLKETGKPFEQVMEEFICWCGEDVRFCTWGPMDLTELQRNMMYYGMEIPFEFPLLFYDVQKLYSRLTGDAQKKSLDQAVEELGIEMERPFHQAMDDAYYTAMVMGKMEFDKVREYLSMDYYQLPEIRKEEVYLTFPEYRKYVSRTFDSKEEALADKKVMEITCRFCKKALRKKIRWFPTNQKTYWCLASCPEHGFVRGKIRVKKSDDGSVFAVKTMKETGEEGALYVQQKKEEMRIKRKEKSQLKKENLKSAVIKK